MQPRTRAAAFTTAAAIFIIITLVVLGFATFITLLLPKQYASTARLTVGGTTQAPFNQPGLSNAPNVRAMSSEVKTIRSPVVLDQVIDELKLNDVWGKKYFNNQQLKTTESRALLERQMDVRFIFNTSTVEISMHSDDKEEAAAIANAIANAYVDYRRQPQKESPADSAKQASASGSAGTPVMIVAPAVPASKPARPNLVVNLFLGGTLGAMIGAVASGFFLFFVLRKPRQATPPPLPRSMSAL